MTFTTRYEPELVEEKEVEQFTNLLASANWSLRDTPEVVLPGMLEFELRGEAHHPVVSWTGASQYKHETCVWTFYIKVCQSLADNNIVSAIITAGRSIPAGTPSSYTVVTRADYSGVYAPIYAQLRKILQQLQASGIKSTISVS